MNVSSLHEAPPLVVHAAIAAALGLAGLVAVALAEPAFALQGWLAAAFALSAVPIGALGLLLMHALTGGPWQRPLAPILRACCGTLPLMALAFLPVILFPSLLYPWAGSGADDPAIAAKAGYLNPVFFALRTVVYFAIWIALVLLTGRADTGGARRPGTLAAGIGVILYAITVSFAAIDWAMSLDPRFSSSAFGMLVGICALLAALSFAIPAAAWLGSPAMRAAADDAKVRAAFAGLLATGVLLWAYVSFMQYLVVWSGDIPEEAAWYLDRVAGGWMVVPWAVGLLLGVLPVAALCLPAGRRSLQRLAAIAALIFVMRVIEAVWLVLPSFPLESWLQPAAWAAAMLALGAGTFAALLWLWALGFRRGQQEVTQHG